MWSAEPLISVVIPAYNYAHLLPRALDSVLGQMGDDVELIVVDDGSRDNTAEVLAEYTARYPQLHAMHQENAGAATARNHGIREARGRHVLLLDADDELVPGALALLLDAQARTPDAGMFLGGQISVQPDGSESARGPSRIPALAPLPLIRHYLLEKRIGIQHCCSMFRRDLLLASPYPARLRKGEDIPVFAYLLVSAPVVTIEQPLARIHKHPDSLRHSRADEEANALAMVEEVFDRLPAECQVLRRQYSAQRYLSLFRNALLAGDRAAARRYYRQALNLHLRQALRWSYLRKALRLLAGV